MIRKIISLRGIGRFENMRASGDVEFKKYTLIFAENGVGKTTLCDVIRSLQTGKPDYILGRKTLNAGVEPEATILLTDGTTARFSGGRWSKQASGGCTIFDTGYVRENVHAGEVVDIEHRRAMFGIVVGQAGVSLHNEVNQLERQRSDLNTPLRVAKQSIEAVLPARMKVDEFIALIADPAIDDKLMDAERNLMAVRERDTILSHRTLEPLASFRLPDEVELVLETTLEGVSATAQQRLDDHLGHLSYERGQQWLSVGLTLVRDDKCPFCAQTLTGNDLIAAYQVCFSAAYKELSAGVAQQQQAVEKAFGPAAITQLGLVLSSNDEALSFWSRYCALDKLPVIDMPAISASIESVRVSIFTLLQQKSTDLLGSMTAKSAETDDALASINVVVKSYYDMVRDANTRIIDLRRNLQSTDITKAQAIVTDLKRRKARFEEPVKTSCDQYISIDRQRTDLTSRKNIAKAALDNHTASVTRDYEGLLNKHLRNFMVGFRIQGTRTEYPSGVPSSSYQLLINDMPVELGRETTTLAEPSFRNTLSGGDRSALALSLFMAQIERHNEHPDIAIILDDPFQSQDAFRKNATAFQIKRCGDRCQQVIVLSHDPVFLKTVYDKLLPDERKALRLVSLGKYTGIAEHDVDEHLKPEQQNRIDVMQRYVNDGLGSPRDVAQKLRPAIEGWCKIVCPGEFADGRMVGEICGIVRVAGVEHSLFHLLDDLEEFNDYAKRYHHATNDDHASTPIVEEELRGYSERILQMMRTRPV